MNAETFKFLAAGLSIGIGSFGPAIAEGLIASKALSAIGRNPEAANKIMPMMFVSMAIAESTGIYAFVVSLIILFG
jgi:F-type H+-transporting ATPase subunit c